MSSQKNKIMQNYSYFCRPTKKRLLFRFFYELIGVKYSDSVSSEMEGLSKNE